MDRKDWKNKWAAENPDAYKQYQREYRQKRRLEDTEFRRRIAQHAFNSNYKDSPDAVFTWTEHIPDAVLETFVSQKNCEICGTEFSNKSVKCLDHNHATRIARGALCRKCNVGLGNFLDDPEILQKAVFYLERTTSR